MNKITSDVISKTTHITPELIDIIRQRIVDEIHPTRILLFGSQARRDQGQDSDIDLLVIHDSPQSDREIRHRLERLFLHRRFGLDLIVRTEDEIARNLADGNPFYVKHIFGQGIVLYERPGVPETG